MAKHPTSVEGYSGSLEDLAKAVGKMRYDCATEFIEKLADDLKRQADHDTLKGRTQLAKKLYQTAGELCKAKEELYSAWKICEPYPEE